MEIPKAVFTRYQSLSVQEGTRRHAVIFPGPVLLSESDVGALVDFIVARDAQNNGLSREQIIVTIQDLNPALSKDQVTLFHLPCCFHSEQQAAGVYKRLRKSRPELSKRAVNIA